MTETQTPTLTEATVRELATSKSFERGQSYYERGAVSDAVRRGDRLQADVAGSQHRPYSVTIEFDETGIARTDCSCPYDHGGICKHRVAVLLTYVRDPDAISNQQPVEALIADADPETIERLLVDLVESRPELAERVQSRLGGSSGETSASAVSVDLESIRRQARNALPNPGPQGYTEAERMASELREPIEQARMATETGDGETALDILETITEEVVDGDWFGLLPYDATPPYEVLGELEEAFAEALLTADPSETEREDWERRLEEWDTALEQFVGEPTFTVAVEAARQGWDDPRIEQAMAGDLDTGEFQSATEWWYNGDLVRVRLAVLDRKERVEEYLNLANAAGQTVAYATMLVREGRIEEAVDYVTGRLSSPRAALDLAETLQNHGETAAALTVAERGLSIEGFEQDTLAAWLRERAADAGEADLAVEAAITAFQASPSLTAYQAVEELAGDDWASVREDLLDFLRDQDPRRLPAASAAEVFLYEELFDDAIDLAERSGRTSVIEPVAAAAVEERPAWVIQACKDQAEPIIEQGQSDSYRTAVDWLETAGEAAEVAGELDEWRAYVETLRDDHYRKYKLRPMLDDLLEAF